MKVAVLDINGKDTGRKVDLSKDVYAIEPNNHAVYLDVKQYLAAQRFGAHKTKERSDVKGSRRKIRKQKVKSKITAKIKKKEKAKEIFKKAKKEGKYKGEQFDFVNPKHAYSRFYY